MNRSISRLFVVVIILIAVLIGWTSRWTVFSASSLDHNKLNSLSLYESWKIKRGRLIADDGKTLARSVSAGGGTWSRHYPFGSLFAQAVGYSVIKYKSSAGLEEYRQTALQGKQSAFASVFGDFSSKNKVGNDVYTTLDPKAQELAKTQLAGRVGSVVAIVPQTGAVKVMYSNPKYNDNDPGACVHTKGCSLVNGATQNPLPPGSTFKVVTTTAALDSGTYNPLSIINGNSPITISGVPLNNDANTSYGDVTLTDALTNSINTVYAQVGEKLGAVVMEKYMKRFGFYANPALDYPANQMIPSGERLLNPKTGKFIKMLLPTDPRVDLGRMSIGQDKLGVTPLQMAMVASAVADDGTLMTPRMTYKAVNSDGQVVDRWPARVYHHVMKPAVAKELQQMMKDVVEEGTGQAANLDGLNAAGKTGTASTGGCSHGVLETDGNCTDGGQPLDDAWFIGFAPISDPKIAVAVELSNIPNGYGGQYAAPIAAQEMKTLLAEGQ